MIKTKKRLLAIFLSFLLTLLFAIPLSFSIASAEDNELDISSKTETWRYIHISLKDTALYFKDFSPLGSVKHPLLGMPESFDATIIVNFNGVEFEGKSVLVTGIVRANCFLSGSVYSYHLTFTDDLKVNIRESYYNYFNQDKYKNSLNSFSLTWYKGAVGWKGYKENSESNFDCAVSFSSAPKPDGADDPDNPNFELGDNGGLDTAPLYKRFNNWWHSVYMWFVNKLGFNLSYEWFCVISISLLILIVVGVTLSIVKRKKS